MNTSFRSFAITSYRCAVLCLAATPLAAQQMIQPVAASTDMPGFASSPPSRLFDQSGLLANYVDGATDFAEFVAATPHRNSNGDSLVTRFVAGGTITLDLGAARTVDAVHLWGLQTAATQLMEFSLFADDDAVFGNGTSASLGSFTGGVGQAGRTFPFTAVTTRFVHIEVLANGGDAVVKVGEAAFRRAAPTDVPQRTILQPAAASTSLRQLFGFVVGHVFDQSGLTAPYQSGQTDFASYVTSTAHANSNAASLLANSNGQNQPHGVVDLGETITLDLGGAQDIDGFALWNTRVGSEALVGFALFADDDGDFDNGTRRPLGEFRALASQAGQAFGFRPVSTRFVHVVVTGHLGGNFLRLGEVAFRLAGQTIGAGCPGSGGVPILVASTAPELNSTFVTSLRGLAPGVGSGFVMIGNAKEPVPVDLGLFGAPGCLLFLNNLVVQQFARSGGAGTFNLPIPADPNVAGITLFEQAFDLDPAANRLGFTTSNALAFTIR